jgi:hypothetical protein
MDKKIPTLFANRNNVVYLPFDYDGGQVKIYITTINGREICATCASLKAAEDWTRQWKVILV